MPRSLKYFLLVVVLLALLPLALIARTRSVRSPRTRVHVIWDMDQQAKYRPQGPSSIFPDGRSMRPPVSGTVARGELRANSHLYTGKSRGKWAATFPMQLTADMVKKGQERFNIFCAPCHGLAGYGDGMVAKRADKIGAGKWVPPASLHSDLVRSRPLGHLFNTISNGIRTMPPYASQIPVNDRWAIIAYVLALQKSQHASLHDVPEQQREKLR